MKTHHLCQVCSSLHTWHDPSDFYETSPLFCKGLQRHCLNQVTAMIISSFLFDSFSFLNRFRALKSKAGGSIWESLGRYSPWRKPTHTYIDLPCCADMSKTHWNVQSWYYESDFDFTYSCYRYNQIDYYHSMFLGRCTSISPENFFPGEFTFHFCYTANHDLDLFNDRLLSFIHYNRQNAFRRSDLNNKIKKGHETHFLNQCLTVRGVVQCENRVCCQTQVVTVWSICGLLCFYSSHWFDVGSQGKVIVHVE